MPFSVLAVRTGEEPPSDFYPYPGEETNRIELEDGDGAVAVFDVTAITVTSVEGDRPRQTAKFSDIAAALIVTDRRVAVACSKFDKGGGWSGFGVGGLAIAVTANAVSKTLVGHVRYDWLGRIEGKDRTGFLSRNSLQILLADPTEGAGVLILDVTLGKRETATKIAADIARRAAAHKAQHCTDDEHRSALERFARQPAAETLGDGTHRYQLPQDVA